MEWKKRVFFVLAQSMLRGLWRMSGNAFKRKCFHLKENISSGADAYSMHLIVHILMDLLKVQIIRLRWLSEMLMDLEILRILETGF